MPQDIAHWMSCDLPLNSIAAAPLSEALRLHARQKSRDTRKGNERKKKNSRCVASIRRNHTRITARFIKACHRCSVDLTTTVIMLSDASRNGWGASVLFMDPFFIAASSGVSRSSRAIIGLYKWSSPRPRIPRPLWSFCLCRLSCTGFINFLLHGRTGKRSLGRFRFLRDGLLPSEFNICLSYDY